MVARKLPHHRRLYCVSTDTRGTMACCTEMPKFQLYGRTLQPESTFGSTIVFGTTLPKFRLPPVSAAHTSPLPVVVGLCAAELSRLQSTAKLPFVSVQPRVPLIVRT